MIKGCPDSVNITGIFLDSNSEETAWGHSAKFKGLYLDFSTTETLLNPRDLA